MLTDARPIPVHHHHHLPASQDDASTAASSPATVDDLRRHDTGDDTEGVSPEDPSHGADLEHDLHVSLKGADTLMADAADVHNAGLEPQPELATEPTTDGTPLPREIEPQVAEDAMDIDVGINVDHIPTPAPPSAAPAHDSQPPLDAVSPASNNTMPSTLDQMRLTPKLASRSPSISRSRSPPATVNGAVSASASLPLVSAPSADVERPAKRQRSDIEGNSVSPPPAAFSPASPALGSNVMASFTPAQVKFATSTVRTLKRQKDALPFNQPVDYIALNIPHYPNIIKTPMDFSTIERKLTASKKGDATGPYRTVDEFVADMHLVWENSYAFNGKEHLVSLMASRLQEMFERQMKHMPPPEDIKPAVSPAMRPSNIVTAVPRPSQPSSAVTKKQVVRRASAATPVVRRGEPSPVDPSLNVNTRPKREIHAPPPKDMPYTDLASSSKHSKMNGMGKRSRRDDGRVEQLKFCLKVLNSMFAKSYEQWFYFFYDPVDATIVPDYYKVIKKPMDLRTIKTKLEQNEYSDPRQVYADFQQIVNNCFTFNPEGSVVREAGKKLKHHFEEKWAGLPPLRPLDSDSSAGESDDDSDIERDRVIKSLEEQVANLNASIESLKASRREKKKRRERAREDRQARKSAKAAAAHDAAYGSKPAKKNRPSNASAHQTNGSAAASSSKAKPGKPPKRPEPQQDEDAYDELDSALDNVQKKELSEAIEKLEGSKLERVINIIQEGVPGIANNSEEIELEIDALPSIVLQRLYNFVVRPMKVSSKPSNAYKVPKRTGSGNTGRTGAAATGGVKRKSMDEAAEAEKIRALEEKARVLAGGAPSQPQGPGMGAGADEDDSVQSSDESGSESESESD